MTLAQLDAIEEQSKRERDIATRRAELVRQCAVDLAAIAKEEFVVMHHGHRRYSREAARRHCQETINEAEHQLSDKASEEFRDWYAAYTASR